MRTGRGTRTGVAWQSGHALHQNPEFAALIPDIEAAASNVLAFVKVVGAPFRITGCWANVLVAGAAHPMHSHPDNFLSGIDYLQTQTGSDTINFHDPRQQTAFIRPPITELTVYDTDQVVVAVSDGTLLGFPARLPHSVSVSKSGRSRISVRFNIMFTAYDTAMSPPLWGRD